MKILLVEDWRRVLRHAWSVRLLVLSFVFDGLEFALPMFMDNPPIERGRFFALAVAVKVLALAFKFISQKEFRANGAD
jgi:hypothetical protein